MREKLRSTRIRESDHAQCNTTINSLQNEISKLSHQLSEASMQNSKNKRTLELEI
jgi:septal ring factor EnvC (AmiA/AmiB activator)